MREKLNVVDKQVVEPMDRMREKRDKIRKEAWELKFIRIQWIIILHDKPLVP